MKKKLIVVLLCCLLLTSCEAHEHSKGDIAAEEHRVIAYLSDKYGTDDFDIMVKSRLHKADPMKRLFDFRDYYYFDIEAKDSSDIEFEILDSDGGYSDTYMEKKYQDAASTWYTTIVNVVLNNYTGIFKNPAPPTKYNCAVVLNSNVFSSEDDLKKYLRENTAITFNFKGVDSDDKDEILAAAKQFFSLVESMTNFHEVRIFFNEGKSYMALVSNETDEELLSDIETFLRIRSRSKK